MKLHEIIKDDSIRQLRVKRLNDLVRNAFTSATDTKFHYWYEHQDDFDPEEDGGETIGDIQDEDIGFLVSDDDFKADDCPHWISKQVADQLEGCTPAERQAIYDDITEFLTMTYNL